MADFSDFPKDRFRDRGANSLSPWHALYCRLMYRRLGEYVGQGADRVVVAHGSDRVVKIPRNAHGIRANRKEHERYRDPEHTFPMAPCRAFGASLLLMKRVETLRFHGDRLPDWAKHVDMGQVGWLNDKLVAYDYGGHVPAKSGQNSYEQELVPAGQV
jgi:hypothetical protein